MALQFTSTEAQALVQGLTSPAYYQLDLPTEGGELHLFAQSDEAGFNGLFNLMRPNQGTLVLDRSQAVELLTFYGGMDVTCRLYGGGHVPAAVPAEAA